MKIEIQIRECKDGFILEDDYEQEEIFFKTFDQALVKANKTFMKFKEDELDSQE